jgi:hypothetical protein
MVHDNCLPLHASGWICNVPGFLSGSWQQCEGGLSGHALYEECFQTKKARNNYWMPLLKNVKMAKSVARKRILGRREAHIKGLLTAAAVTNSFLNFHA